MCHPNPCLHGGVCLSKGTEYECHCPVHWAGRNCESKDFTKIYQLLQTFFQNIKFFPKGFLTAICVGSLRFWDARFCIGPKFMCINNIWLLS